jgi:hypothetical protein
MSSESYKTNFDFLGVKFTKEKQLPENYETFLNMITQIYQLNLFQNIDSHDLKFHFITGESKSEMIVTNKETYEQFISSNNENQIDVIISFKTNNSLNEKKDNEHKKSKKSKENDERCESFQKFVEQVVENAFEDAKKNLESLLCEKNLTNLQITNVTCNGCNCCPIKGFVYKCFVCEETQNFCEDCSAKHEHPMLREIDCEEELETRPDKFESYCKEVIQLERTKLQERIIKQINDIIPNSSTLPKVEKQRTTKCSGELCELKPIKGKVFHCVICANKSFCERCSGLHKHTMIIET